MVERVTQLRELHGDMFDYIRAVQLDGCDDLDLKHFPNVVYCAHYYRKRIDRTFENVKVPSPTVDRAELESLATTPLKKKIELSESAPAFIILQRLLGMTTPAGDGSGDDSSSSDEGPSSARKGPVRSSQGPSRKRRATPQNSPRRSRRRRHTRGRLRQRR